MDSLEELFRLTIVYLFNAKDSFMFALFFFLIFGFRLFFKIHDRILFFVILGCIFLIPFMLQLLIGGGVGNDKIGNNSNFPILGFLAYYSIIFMRNFIMCFMGGLIGFYLSEFFIRNYHISKNIKRFIAGFTFVLFFSAWLWVLYNSWNN